MIPSHETAYIPNIKASYNDVYTKHRHASSFKLSTTVPVSPPSNT